MSLVWLRIKRYNLISNCQLEMRDAELLNILLITETSEWAESPW